jgi:glycosyltransferase involved in cell wall biosynthesis
MGSLAAIVLARDEETNLPACLSSLQQLKCHILVVDSGSTDRTIEIAHAMGAMVIEHCFETYAAQRNWAQEHLPWPSDWILHLDADERLTPELVGEINATLPEVPPNIVGFLLRKRTVFMGRWIRHGGHYPSYHLRLYRHGAGHCERRLYDQHFLVDGKVGQLHHDYIDVLTADLTTWTVRHARWAGLEAHEVMRRSIVLDQVRPSFWGSPIERRRWLRTGPYYHAPLFLRAFLYWLYRYVFRYGFLDGPEGMIFHFLQGFWYRFLVDAKIYERQRAKVE